jgi:hypothetical protein
LYQRLKEKKVCSSKRKYFRQMEYYADNFLKYLFKSHWIPHERIVSILFLLRLRRHHSYSFSFLGHVNESMLFDTSHASIGICINTFFLFILLLWDWLSPLILYYHIQWLYLIRLVDKLNIPDIVDRHDGYQHQLCESNASRILV